jgi:crotonobetainyl-CoA:carnitine CoA-transferase CaiB-like acyl-CoA transferase
VPLVAGVLRERTQREWLDLLEPAGIPCGPINRIDQVFADPQVIARGMRIDLPHPLAGTVPQVGNPVRFSATPVSYDLAPPLLGEHTAEILGERLGFADATIAELARRGVVGVR